MHVRQSIDCAAGMTHLRDGRKHIAARAGDQLRRMMGTEIDGLEEMNVPRNQHVDGGWKLRPERGFFECIIDDIGFAGIARAHGVERTMGREPGARRDLWKNCVELLLQFGADVARVFNRIIAMRGIDDDGGERP